MKAGPFASSGVTTRNAAPARISAHAGKVTHTHQKRETFFQVRILVKKYNPAVAKRKSGDHAANVAGSRLMSPNCSNSLPIAQYAMAIPKLTATPAVAPRVPAIKAKGTEINA